MRALVTGSRGFVGTWLLRHLRSVGDEVVELPEGLDVARRDEVLAWYATHADGVEACYHLAAQASVARSFADPVGTWTTNAIGTQNVVDGLVASAPEARLLVVSSSEVYGAPRPEELPIGEDAPLRPASPYAASKVGAEAAARSGFHGRGLAVVIARPFNHVGPGQGQAFVVPALLARIRSAVAAGERTIAVGNLAARRDFSDVREVVAAYRALVVSGVPGEVYNVCSGTSYAIAEILELILAKLPVELEAVVDPELLRPVDVPEIRGDPSRLERATGMRPARPLAEILDELVAEALSPRPANPPVPRG